MFNTKWLQLLLLVASWIQESTSVSYPINSVDSSADDLLDMSVDRKHEDKEIMQIGDSPSKFKVPSLWVEQCHLTTEDKVLLESG